MPHDDGASGEPAVPEPGWIHRDLAPDIFGACHAGDAGRLIEILRDSPEAVHRLNDSRREAPLHYARNSQIAGILLRWGAEIDHRNADGQTALHFACKNGNLERAAFLARSGAELRTPDGFGYTAMLRAAYTRGDEGVDIVRLLMGYGVPLDLNSALVCGLSGPAREILAGGPAAVASAPKPEDLLRDALIRASLDLPDPDTGPDLFGPVPGALPSAVAGHLELIDALLARGAPLDGALVALRTALGLPDATLAERLLAAGVPLTGPDHPGRSGRELLDAADQSACRDEMIALLGRYGIEEGKG